MSNAFGNTFMDFKFHDDKAILPQVINLKNLVIKLNNENILVCEKFFSGAIIYKLSPS